MIAPTSFFSDYGGHIRILEETLALQALGHQVTIVTYYKGRDLPGVDIRRTASLPYRADYEVGSSRHKIAFDIYLAIKSLRVALRERPDLIHGHMHEGALIGAVLAKLLSIPLIFDYQGSLTAEMADHGFLQAGGWPFRFLRRIERMINHRPQAILTSSQQARDQLRETFEVPNQKVVPLPDCVDLSRFNRDRFSDEELHSVRERYGIAPDAFLVVYLGLLTDYQGIPHLLQAAERLKQRGRHVHFLIMGFPNVPHYSLMATEMGVGSCVTFTGKIPYDDAPMFLTCGDIAITAKVSATEGSGKLLNYMALQLPVVAYDTAVHREYLGPHGVYVTPHDIDGLADAVDELLHDPQMRAEKAAALYQRVASKFTWAAAAQQIGDVYERECSAI